MASPLTAKEMAALEKARQNVKKETYKAILEQFSRKIRTSHELGHKEAHLTVPPFVVGFPRYDLPKAVKYLCRQLQKLGYSVAMIGPVSFKVRWDKHKTQAVAEPEAEDTPFDLLPGLVNMQKMAQKIRVTKGK
jgi:hypothetical protein